MTTYGYVRQGHGKGTMVQLELLLNHGCDKLFIEKENDVEGSELRSLLEILEPLDQVIVSDLSIFNKSLSDWTQLLGFFQKKETVLTSIEDELTIAEGAEFYTNLLLFEKLDREYKRRQVVEAYQTAKSEGRSWGRPRINGATVQKIQFLYKSEKLSLREIANLCEVSLGTVHKYVSEIKAAAQLEGN